MVKRLDHIGIAVENLDESISKWCSLFDLKLRGKEEIKPRKLEVAMLDLEGGPTIELIASAGTGSTIDEFIQKRGEGIHHFCFEVQKVEAAIKTLAAQGIKLVSEEPQMGAEGSLIAFIHPRSFNGVLIELKQKK
jgi:methylmalonyl-CoA epimerase